MKNNEAKRKRLFFAFLLAGIAIVLLSGCIWEENDKNENAGNDLANTAMPGDTVKVHYTGRLENGTEFDSSEGKQPLQFTIDSGLVIRGFNDAVIGMKVGEEQTVRIEPKFAYGEFDESKVASFDLNQLNVPPGFNVSPGAELYFGNNKGIIQGIDENKVTVNFNHALAGQTLYFTIRLVEVQKKG